MTNLEHISRRRTVIRAGLVLLGAVQLSEGLWQLLAPASWFRDFPYPGAHWSALFGGYSEHNVRDLGAAMTAIGFLLIAAAASLRRSLVQLALATYVVLQLPHAIFHFLNDYRLSDTGQVLNGLAVALSVAVPITLLVLSRRRPGAAAGRRRKEDVASEDGFGARIEPARRGLLYRAADLYTRRVYGHSVRPVRLYAHIPALLLGYGALEAAFEHTSRVERRLKTLAELRASAVTQCEWCMDFGSAVARDQGIDDHVLRELPGYADSDAFTTTEKLVLDYATAITRTPCTVDDAMVQRLKDEFSDEQILELTVAATLENYRARFNSALGVRPEGFSAGSYCVVPVDEAGRRSVDPAIEP